MCYLHPVLAETLVRDRCAEIRRGVGASAHTRPEQRRHRLIEAVRHRTGWLLVDMGLRLAAPRSALHDPVARSPR